MATKIQLTAKGWFVSQFRGFTRAKRYWTKPVLVPAGDEVELRAEILRQCDEARLLADRGGLQ